MLTVRLNGMIFRSRIGVFKSEKSLYQSLQIDISMQIPRIDGLHWELHQSIDYSVIYGEVQQAVEYHSNRGTNLLETVAQDIATRALLHHPHSVTVTVSKIQAKIPKAGAVANIGCRITRP
jgi:FolB domain-containing protein